jgi:hypothetical protein
LPKGHLTGVINPVFLSSIGYPNRLPITAFTNYPTFFLPTFRFSETMFPYSKPEFQEKDRAVARSSACFYDLHFLPETHGDAC